MAQKQTPPITVQRLIILPDIALLVGWVDRSGDPELVELAGQKYSPAQYSVTRFKHPKVPFENGGYLIALPTSGIGSDTPCIRERSSLSLSFGERRQVSGALAGAHPSELDAFLKVLDLSNSNLDQFLVEYPRAMRVVQGLLKQQAGSFNYKFDQIANLSDTGMFVKGWCYGSGLKKVSFMTPSLSGVESKQLSFDRHGKLAQNDGNQVENGIEERQCDFYCWHVADAGSGALNTGALVEFDFGNYSFLSGLLGPAQSEGKPADVASLVDDVAASVELDETKASDIARLLAAAKTETDVLNLGARLYRFGPSETAKPDVSIIVPFYKVYWFMFHHLEAQRSAPDGVGIEWIFVCDEPEALSDVQAMLSARSHTLEQPVTLLGSPQNLGYGGANTLAKAVASGDYLLLMNSDVYCNDLEFIKRSVAAFEADPALGALGYTLRFEDETLQHSGMKFEPEPLLSNLIVANHPGKGGAAATSTHDNLTEVDAVTAALMMVANDQDLQLFDPIYVRGDFEDADLCLRLRKAGKKIGLMNTGGLYHLERQSIREMAEDRYRNSITLINALTFNSRWFPGGKLSLS